MLRMIANSMFVLCLVFAAVGCSSEKKEAVTKVAFKGKLVDKGQPWSYDASKVKLPKGTSMPPGLNAGGNSAVKLTLSPVQPGVPAINVNINESDGTFVVPEILPGKYKFAITFSANVGTGSDPFGNKFTAENTKIIRDINGGEEIEIDISKPQG
jgi:hypothetical protein